MVIPHPDTVDGDGADHHTNHVPPPAVPIRDGHWHVPWPNRKTLWAKLTLVPGFGWLVVLYSLGTLALGDVHAVLEVGIWKMSWAVFILALASIVITIELTRLSQPGINQMDEVIAIGAFFVLQVVLVTVAFTTNHFVMFKTTEGLLLVITNGFQTWGAYKVNANSLVRTFAPAAVTN